MKFWKDNLYIHIHLFMHSHLKCSQHPTI
jgi:hypothetical protein